MKNLIFVALLSICPSLVHSNSNWETIPSEVRDLILQIPAFKDVAKLLFVAKSQKPDVDRFLIRYFANNSLKVDMADTKEAKATQSLLRYIDEISKKVEKPYLMIIAKNVNNDNLSDLLKHSIKAKSLDFDNNEVLDLAKIAQLTNLEGLSLENNAIDDDDVEELSNLTNLKALNLRANNIKDLTEIAKLTNLEDLNLSQNEINAESNIEVLSHLTKLKRLNLSTNYNINPYDLNLSIIKMTDLQYLNLFETKIGDKAVKDFSEYLKNLEELDLTSCQISPTGAREISKIPMLKKLYLGNNQIGDEGAKYIADTEWTKLKMLNILSNNITEIGAKYIVYSKNLKDLEMLWMDFNNIGINGANYFIDADPKEYLPKLKLLSLMGIGTDWNYKETFMKSSTIQQRIKNGLTIKIVGE